jgi:hypothetical protein
MPTKGRYNPTERLGVNAVERFVLEILGWIFRDQPIVDVGIDAHVEICDSTDNEMNSEPTGRLLALQIKTGASYFNRPTDNGWTFYGELEHLDYWTTFSLPVILVLYDLEKCRGYWVQVTSEAVEYTKTKWRIIVPSSQPLNETAKEAWSLAAGSTRTTLSFRRLVLARPLMEAAVDDDLILEVDEWLNKSSGRTDFGNRSRPGAG